MHIALRQIFVIAGVVLATQATAQVTFFEQDYFRGESFSTQRQVRDLSRFGFNDQASSAQVTGGRWEVCEDSRFRGRCVVLREGRYGSLADMGLNNRVSSARLMGTATRIDDDRYAPMPTAEMPDFRRRNNERVYQARVTSVRAVVGPPEQRCWIEQEQVASEQSSANLPGAVVGALLGGVLGHQVGGGSGKDLATIGGLVAGAALGNQVGRNNAPQPAQTRDVQRCSEVPSQAAPQFWDVTYNFRGMDHHAQLTAPPGRNINVNQQGEPRE